MGKLLCYVGLFPGAGGSEFPEGMPTCGGISVYEVTEGGKGLKFLCNTGLPDKAGALAYCEETHTLYAVNEKKTKGRGEQESGSNIYSFRVDMETGALTELNHVQSMGATPTDLAVVPGKRQLCVACHGGNDHVEKVVQNSDGTWGVVYDFDDGTTSLFALNEDGSIGRPLDVKIHAEHGLDPNTFPQHGGHSMQCGHSHCVSLDPTGRYVLAGDKGADRIYVYRIGETSLTTVCVHQFTKFSGARHVRFDPSNPGRMFITLEFSSEIASFDFDQESGMLKEIDRISTVSDDFKGHNEPATLRVSSDGRFIYLNNRGEDNIAIIEASPDGKLCRKGAFDICRSGDPGAATRQLQFTPDERYLYVAERPANDMLILKIDAEGMLSEASRIAICNPVYMCFVEIN